MFHPTSVDSQSLQFARQSVDAFLGNLSDAFKFTVNHADRKDKSGVVGYTGDNIAKIFVRSVVDARSSDLLIGIVINGTHVGIASSKYMFTVGDVISNSNARFEVVNATLKTGNIYWVLDLAEKELEDVGELL